MGRGWGRGEGWSLLWRLGHHLPNRLYTPNSRSSPSGCCKDTPILGLGPPLDPPLDTRAFMQPSPGAQSSIVPLWPPGPACGAGRDAPGLAVGRQQAGSRLTAGRKLGPSRGLAPETGNC